MGIQDICLFSTLIIFSLSFTSAQIVASPRCPEQCLCFDRDVGLVVRCMFLGLEAIPPIPTNTSVLDLRFNRLAVIQRGNFVGLSRLTTLLLNTNEINSIEDDTFQGLSNLKYLYLYKNKIKSLGQRAFDGLSNLEQLYLHSNNVDHIESSTFDSLTSLQKLFLHNNELTTLASSVLSSLTTLTRLRLDSNPLVCDCSLKWLKKYTLNSQQLMEVAATCSAPDILRGIPISEVPDEDFYCDSDNQLPEFDAIPTQRPNPIASPPSLTATPDDLHARRGEKVHLRCAADGNPEPNIVWYHNRRPVILNSIQSASRFHVLNDGSLMIDGLQSGDEGSYSCMAQNSLGQENSPTATLVLQNDAPAIERPEFILRPRDQSASIGGSISLTCTVTGAADIRWYKDNRPYTLDSSRSTRLASGTMLITEAESSDAGVYRCTASIGNEAVHASARVTIRELPYFIDEPESVSVVEGGVAYFRCAADGHPKPSVTWTVNGRFLRDSPRFSISNNSTNLRISGVNTRDGGTYTCQATNVIGSATSSATLSVFDQSAPEFESEPKTYSTEIGADLELECRAEGQPDPLISWYRNSEEIIHTENEKYDVNSEGFLVINNITFSDAGSYECHAINSVGSKHITLQVQLVGSSQIVYPGDQFAEEALRTARNDVGNAADQTLREIRDRKKPLTSSDLLALFKFPSEGAQSIARSTEIFERTLELIIEKVYEAQNIQMEDTDHYRSVRNILSPSQIRNIADLSGCAESRAPIDCTDMCFHMKYRSIDGTCNNLRKPVIGSSLTKFARWLPPIYENNFNLPVGWNVTRLYHGFPKPSARLISTQILSSAEISPDERFTSFLMQWGQFLDHDITFTPMSVSRSRFSDGRHCNSTCDNQAPCFPILTPPGDERLGHRQCIGVTRSSAACGSGMTSVFFKKVTHREQLNELTAYIDASNVYGSTDSFARSLRNFASRGGQLRTGLLQTLSGKPLLPFNTNAPMDCQVDPTKTHVPCFLAGDLRANEQLGLLTMHTLFVREHNRLAQELADLNPHWDNDMVYHETRKIVGALMQHVTYQHWLPNVIGPVGMSILGDYKGYDPNTDPTILNVFATAAFRFGHSLINPILYRFDENMTEHQAGHLSLHKAFFAPFRIVEEGGIDPLVRGLFGASAKLPMAESVFNEELTEKLFKLAHQVALDLAALNVQRGRDHALPGYNEWRKKCGLNHAQTFDELANEIPDVAIRMRLEKVYGHPSNIDLFVGAMVERLMPGARVGPTFMCILAEQFRRLRNGDRFYYESPGVFSPVQLAEIKQFTLSHMICKSSDNITQVPTDVFRVAQFPQQYVRCDSGKIPEINLKVWSQCCHDCERSGDFQSITSSVRSNHRGRRSVEQQYSYANEKPQDWEMASNQSMKPASIKSLKPSVEDVLEERVEGLEETIEIMAGQINLLLKKLKDQNDPTGCLHEGKVYKTSEIWHISNPSKNLCSQCVCQDGVTVCQAVRC